MGNQICTGDQILDEYQEGRPEITSILQDFPSILRGSMFRGTTTRYMDLSVLHEDYNRYIFILKTEGNKEMRVVIPVLNELAHRALHPNYKLKIGRQAIIDPFDDRFESTLLPVRNQSAGLDYSMRMVPFKSYNNIEFKRVLEEIWIYQSLQRYYELHRNKSSQDPRLLFLWLEDYYIYGVNSDRQAIVMLYERTQNSLLLGAEYRQKAKMPWSVSEKLKIMRDVLMGCIRLSELKISHREIRASNIFYVEKQQRYMIGGFSCVRESGEDEQLLTVNGIEIQSQGHLRELISEQQNMGLYRADDTLYASLKALNRLLQTRRISDELGPYNFKDRTFGSIDDAFMRKQPLSNILKTVERSIKDVERVGEFGQQVNIARKIPGLIPEWYAQKCERFLFETYSCLGYQIQFSQMAHKVIERNNIDQRPFANAVILKELGLFYEKYGTGGSEYLLNACILYCKQAEYEIERELYDDAQMHIEEGEEIYIKLSTMGDFPLSMIELKRLRAELRARTIWKIGNGEVREAQIQDIFALMGKTLTLAGEQNLPIQKQMKLFLTWGVVHRDCGDRLVAEQRFKNGLAVCENPGAFQSQTTASLAKAHFLFQMSVMDLQLLHGQHDPLLPQQAQNYNPVDLPKKVQDNLQQALNLRQKETTRIYQVAQVNMALGELYLLLNQFLEANVQLKRALIQLQDLRKREKIPYETMVQLHYDLGSINYKLQGYSDAIEYYKEAVKILEDNVGDKYWSHVINGNLGLAYLRVNQNEKGKLLLDRAKQYIKSENGAKHYDYLFLSSQQQVISRNKL